MKLKFLTFGITALCFPAWAQTDKIVEHELSESKVFEVHTGKGVTTTLLFPAQIAVVGGSLVTDPQKEQGLMSFTPGPSHFTISGLRDKGSTNVNVFCQGKAYSIILSVSDSPVYKAHFVSEGEGTASKTAKKKAHEVAALNGEHLENLGEHRNFSPNRILGFMDKCKALPVLAVQKDNPVKDILFTPKEKKYVVEGYTVEMQEMYRDNALDAICVKLVFESTNGEQHIYDPEGFGLSAGTKYFQQITASADGVIPPSGKKIAYFCIAGDGKGGRNELSLHTNFELHMTPLEREDCFTEDRSGDALTLFKSQPKLGIVEAIDSQSLLLPALPNVSELPKESNIIDEQK